MECIMPGIKRMSPSCLLHVVGRNILPSRAPCLLKFVGGRKERAPPAPTPCIPCAPTCLTSFQVLCLRTGTRSGKNTISSKNPRTEKVSQFETFRGSRTETWCSTRHGGEYRNEEVMHVIRKNEHEKQGFARKGCRLWKTHF